MRGLLVAVVAAGLLACCHAGSGKDLWGIDTLTGYPPGEGRKELPVQAGDTGAPTPIDLPCQCSDADPRDEATQTVTFDCFYQRFYGKCSDPNMFDANAELAPEGFCQMSCSRCNCCQSAWDVLQGLGATRFLQAAEAAQPSLKDLLQHPGFTATLLAPTNAAFDAALARYQGLLQNPAALQELIKFHILPPEPVRRGLWTSPFLSLGPKLYTLSDGPQTLTASRFAMPAGTTWRGGLTGFQINGPYNAATVVQSDVLSCKSVITLIDTVLLPFNPATPPPNDTTAAAVMLGVQGCAVQPNALIAGQQIKAGEGNRQATVGSCCDSCRATSGCTAFFYCSQKGGCRMPAGASLKTYQYGHCELLASPELAAGQAPRFLDFNPITVSVISGWVAAGPAPAIAPVSTAAPVPPPVSTTVPVPAPVPSAAPASPFAVLAAEGVPAGRRRRL